MATRPVKTLSNTLWKRCQDRAQGHFSRFRYYMYWVSGGHVEVCGCQKRITSFAELCV